MSCGMAAETGVISAGSMRWTLRVGSVRTAGRTSWGVRCDQTFRGLRMESGATIPDWSGKKWVPTSYQTGLVRRLYFSYQTGLVRSKYSLLTRLVDLEKNVCIMNLVEKVQPSYQTGLVSNEYLLLNRPVWYEVRAYFLPDWSGNKAVLFLPDSYLWLIYTGCPKKKGK